MYALMRTCTNARKTNFHSSKGRFLSPISNGCLMTHSESQHTLVTSIFTSDIHIIVHTTYSFAGFISPFKQGYYPSQSQFEYGCRPCMQAVAYSMMLVMEDDTNDAEISRVEQNILCTRYRLRVSSAPAVHTWSRTHAWHEYFCSHTYRSYQ
jgi:hypothetical protein